MSSAAEFKSPSGQSCSVMSSKFFAETDPRKTSAVRRRSRSTTRSVSCSSAQLFRSGLDDAPWHGHKIIAADCFQDDARTPPLSSSLFARCTFSSASPPHSHLVTNKKLSQWSRSLIQSPTGCPGEDHLEVRGHNQWLSEKNCNSIVL